MLLGSTKIGKFKYSKNNVYSKMDDVEELLEKALKQSTVYTGIMLTDVSDIIGYAPNSKVKQGFGAWYGAEGGEIILISYADNGILGDDGDTFYRTVNKEQFLKWAQADPKRAAMVKRTIKANLRSEQPVIESPRDEEHCWRYGFLALGHY